MKKTVFRPQVESLEGRDLMSAGVTGTWSGGVLKLNGTASNDTITLRQSGNQVTIDGFSGSLDARQIQRISIAAGAGNDTVNLQISSQLANRVFADGGAGVDVIKTPANPASRAGFESGYYIAPPATTTGHRDATETLWVSEVIFNTLPTKFLGWAHTYQEAGEISSRWRQANPQSLAITNERLATPSELAKYTGMQTPKLPADRSFSQYKGAVDNAMQKMIELFNRAKQYQGYLTPQQGNVVNQAIDAYNDALKVARNSPTQAIRFYFRDSPNYPTAHHIPANWVMQMYTIVVRFPSGEERSLETVEGTLAARDERLKLYRSNYPAYTFDAVLFSRRY